MDLDGRQARLPERCQELSAAERCELLFPHWRYTFTILPKAAPLTLFSPQVEYKYDKEIMKGCVIPVVDDKLTLLALKNNEMNSYVRHV